jgi:hypothetical protein
MKLFKSALLALATLATGTASAQVTTAPQAASIGVGGYYACPYGYQLVVSPGYLTYNVCQLQPVLTPFGYQYQNVCFQQIAYTPYGAYYCVASPYIF